MESAYKNKDTKFYIKTKFNTGWIDRIEAIKKKYIKIYNDSLSNVIITSEIPAQDLIKKSKLVIGINSSALIEAKVLGIDVLIPIFDELKKNMQSNVYFKEYFGNELSVVESKD